MQSINISLFNPFSTSGIYMFFLHSTQIYDDFNVHDQTYLFLALAFILEENREIVGDWHTGSRVESNPGPFKKDSNLQYMGLQLNQVSAPTTI